MAKDKSLDDLHATALAQFKFIAETETAQRARELEALRFQAGDQWTADAKLSRAGMPGNTGSGTPAVPARPMLTMRTLDQPIAQIVNQEHDADLAITITAKDGKANKDTAEVIAGLVRAIQNDSHADDVYSWGFQRMVGCGRGYWRVNKDYANDQDGQDQVIRIAPIENGFSVYLDPLPTWQPNGGFWEPEYGFVTQDIPEAEYRREFGESKLANASDAEELTSMGDNRDFWVIENKTDDGKQGGKFYRIAEYWYAVYTKQTVGDRTTIQQRTIKWAKMNGCEWLDEPQEWDGRYIPIIEDTGNTYNVGGEVIYEGVVQPSIGPCRMLNFMVSGAAEKIGMDTSSPWIGIAGQFQGFESWWDQANVRNFSKLEYNAITAATGPNVLPPPQRNNVDPQIQAYSHMIALFTNFIRGTTGVPDAALGNVNPNDRSGKAIEELKIASQQGTSGWLTHHARAIRQTGIIVVDLIPKIYDRPGRVERIIGKDKAEDWVMLNQPFTKGQDGQPQAAQPPGLMQRGMQALGMGSQGPKPEMHDLTKGQYGVIVNVGKSQQTLKAETFAGMNALAQAAPELVPRFADLWVESMDIPQAEAIAARIKPPGVGDDGEPDPQQVMAENQQLKAAMQELQALADDNQAKLKIAEMKAQTDMAKAQQDGQLKAMTTQAQEQSKAQAQAQADHTKLEIAALQANTAIAVAQLKAGQDEMKNAVQLMLKKMDLAHDTHMHVVAQQDEQTGKVLDHEIGEHSAERDHERARDLQSREHEQEIMTSQIPPPKDPNKQMPGAKS